MSKEKLLVKSNHHHTVNNPVFIHSLWRTGSTYLFHVFRRSKGGYWCYQEPIHEAVLNCRDKAEDLLLFEEEKMLELRHPMLEKPYYLELYEIWEHWQGLISKQIIYDGYFDRVGDKCLVNYLKALITHAKGRPVIQECRTSCRIMAIKKALGGVHLYLWRNPWDQWWSFKSASYFNAVSQLVLNAKNHPGVISLARQEIGFSEFHDESIDDEVRYFLENPLSAENNYLIFYLLWCLGLLEGMEHADILINIDMLSNSEEYRNAIHGYLEQHGINDINVSDSKVPQLYYMEEDRNFFHNLEERVYEILLLSGHSKAQLKQLHTLRESHEPRLRSLPLADIPSEALWPSCARAREIVLRYETEISRLLYQKGCQICDQRKKCELSGNELEVLRNREAELQRDLEMLRRQENCQAKDQSEEIGQARHKIEMLLRTLALREKEIGTQLLAAQEQARREIAEQAQRNRELGRAVQEEYARREQELLRQIEAGREALCRFEQEKEVREKDLSGEIGRTRHEMAILLRTMAVREREVASSEIDSKSAQQSLQLEVQRLGFELTSKQDELKYSINNFKNIEEQFKWQIEQERKNAFALQERLSEAERAVHMMKASSSWRITIVLRKLASLFKSENGFMPTAPVGEQAYCPPERLQMVSGSQPVIIQQPFTEMDRAMSLSAQRENSDSCESIAATLEDLLALHDQPFIECAYQTILGRAPDLEGLRFYLGRLRTGISRLHIVAELALSQEGKGRKIKLPGLHGAVTPYKRARYPLIGWLFRFSSRIHGNNSTERQLRRIENQIFLLGEESNSRFNQMEKALSILHRLAIQETRPVVQSQPDPHQFSATSEETNRRLEQMEKTLSTICELTVRNPLSGQECRGGASGMASAMEPLSHASPWPFEPEELNQLTPRARNIYRQLKCATEEQEGTNLCVS